MFDRPTHVHVAPASPTPVHVDVHVPKTEAVDAAKLYGELLEKARIAVRAAVVNELGASNEFKVARIDVFSNIETMNIGTEVAFELNGTLHSIRLNDALVPDDFERKAWLPIAKQLADRILAELIDRAHRTSLPSAASGKLS